MSPDINNLNLVDEFVEVNYDGASAEDFFTPPLPDDGEHVAVLKLGNRGVTISRQKDKSTGEKTGPAFVNAHIQVKLLKDTGEEGLSVFDNATSILMGPLSRLHVILMLAGSPAPARLSVNELRDFTEQVLAQSPRVKVTTQWEAQIKEGNDYRTVLKGQKKFPPILDESGNPTGRYNSEVLDPKSNQTVRAQAQVVKYAKA